ncbi:MAG: CotH kinase family protein, partial [Bacillota bacterium]
MLHSKHIEKICGVLVLLCFAISFVFMQSESFGITSAESNNYEQHFFSELNVNTIDIIVDETAWQNLLDTASSKEYIVCDLLINGERFSNIAIRAKGNSSLQQVQSSDSDRYSFKIEFDHYDKTKTYYGLDKLALNNIIQDNTFMKDYMAYTLMGEFGVASPLVNYTNVSVNGEAFGLYLAVEAIEEAFLQRNYGNSYGIAYKPETTGGGGDQMQMGEMPMGQMPMGEMPMGEMPTGEMPMGKM